MIPKKIHLHKKTKQLELVFEGEPVFLSAEFLRVHSPSAEVKGHGPGQEVLVDGKKHVGIKNLSSAGNYALQIEFDDGHDTGIYSWSYLADLAANQEKRWQTYLSKLEQADKSRDPHTAVIKFP